MLCQPLLPLSIRKSQSPFSSPHNFLCLGIYYTFIQGDVEVFLMRKVKFIHPQLPSLGFTHPPLHNQYFANPCSYLPQFVRDRAFSHHKKILVFGYIIYIYPRGHKIRPSGGRGKLLPTQLPRFDPCPTSESMLFQPLLPPSIHKSRSPLSSPHNFLCLEI